MCTSSGKTGQPRLRWSAGSDNPCQRSTESLNPEPWGALGPDRTQRLADLTLPLLVKAFESNLLPAQSTLGIATVPAPTPRP